MTDANSNPLAGVTISVKAINPTAPLGRTFPTSAITAADGSYTTIGFPAGTAQVFTSNSLGYINEVFDNVPCAQACVPSAGSSIPISLGQTTPNINFALTLGDRVTGVVTDNSLAPISGISVQVFNTSAVQVASATTNGTGAYATAELPGGTYFVRTSNALGYIDRLYNGLSCSPSCTVTTGTPVVVSVGQTTPPVNFTLALGGRISGLVTNNAGGTGVGGITVQVFNSGGGSVVNAGTSTVPATLGAYTTSVLPAGTYYVRTANPLGFLDELYDDLPCVPSCTVTTGTPVTIVAGQTTSNVNFGLALTGRISGVVTDSATGTGISGVTVQVFNSSGTSQGTVGTGAGGTFITPLTLRLAAGSYFVRTVNALGYFDEVYNDIPCLQCSVTTGSPVGVAAGQTSSGINFALAKGGQIAGQVTDAVTHAGIPGVTLFFIDVAGRTLATGTTGAGGTYGSPGLPSGMFFMRATPPTNLLSYIAAVYQGLACLPCTPTNGTPISVTAGSVTNNINMALDTGGQISGTIKDATTLSPINMQVDVFNSSGISTGVTQAAPTGSYTTAGLPSGTYYVRTRLLNATTGSVGYVNKLYSDVVCSGCNPMLGMPVVVTANQTTSGINILLSQGTRVSGHVQNTGAQPISGVSVSLFNAAGLQASSATTDASGNYTSLEALAAGTYYARTVNTLGYINKLYNVAAPCFPTCTPTSGTSITVPGTGVLSGIDFSLVAGARVSGTITDAVGAPLNGVFARLYDSVGTFIAQIPSGITGSHISPAGIPAGTYYLATGNSIGYINQVYAGTPCLGCNPAAAGTPLALVEGTTTSGIDFALDQGGRVSGTVTASAGGAPLPGVTVEVFTAPFTAPAATGTTDQLGNYVSGAGLPTGTDYKARTTNSLGYINERFNDISCLDSCPPDVADSITVVAPATTSAIAFALDADADADGDGILSSIDPRKSTPSDDFSDVAQGGTTTGTIVARQGWNFVVGDIGSGGVQAQVSGAGSGPARFSTCAVGGAEEVELDVNGETATITCAAGTGSTTVKAIVAAPTVVLQKTVNGLTTVLELAPGQTATIGSPAVADPANDRPVHARLLDSLGIEIGSFDLDPGESAEATEATNGLIGVTVFSGNVTVTVGSDVVTLSVGETHGFVLCAPLAIEALKASPAVLSPPNHKMVPVTLSPTLSGTCGTATCQIVSVTSNESINGLGDGDTSPDWVIGQGLTLSLRAERSGTGPGRIYTVTVRCTDEAGTVVTKVVTVSVPR